MAAQDFYDILGVGRDADEAAIKQAYRRLAKQYHPDKNPGDKEAERKFKDVNEAFNVLGNKKKREQYDTYGASMGSSGHGADFRDIFGNFNDIFSDFFGQGRQGGERRDLRFEISIAFVEAYKGVTKNIRVPIRDVCARCHGTGAKDDQSVRQCDRCGGSGRMHIRQGIFTMQQTCSACGGQGSVITAICPACGGERMTQTHKTIKVHIPAGINDGDNLRLSGQGGIGLDGHAGDLFVQVRVNSHPLFTRHGRDLLCELPITVVDAALGGTVELEALEGKLSLRIPSGTQSGKLLRLRGKGMPNPREDVVGDLICRVQVEVPVNLSTEQEDLLQQLRRSFAKDKVNHSPGHSSWKDKVRHFFN